MGSEGCSGGVSDVLSQNDSGTRSKLAASGDVVVVPDGFGSILSVKKTAAAALRGGLLVSGRDARVADGAVAQPVRAADS